MIIRKSVVRGLRGFTLLEVVVSLSIFGVAVAGLISGYTRSAQRAEWSGYSLAAEALAIQQLEQARAAKWDVLADSPVNEITNLPAVTSATLDLPVAGTNVVYATNYITIKSVTINSSPPCAVQMVQVATVWPFIHNGATEYFTNTVANYYAPDR